MAIRKTTKGKGRNYLSTSEELFDIPNYEGYYKINIKGDVYSLCNGFKKRKIRLNTSGYPYLKLSKNGKQKMVEIHRILAKIFIPNPKNLPQVDHINGNRTDNSIINLRWCDNRQNQSYRFEKIKTTSKYTGVVWHKNTSKWQAQAKINGNNKYLGIFNDELLAKEAYDNFLKKEVYG